MRSALLLVGLVLIGVPGGRTWQEPQPATRTTIPPTGRVIQLPIVPGEPPCLVSIDAWLPETWSEPAYELKEVTPGSFYEVPAGTHVKNGKPDQSETARRDIDRVLYALETALAFSDDMAKKTRGACRQLGSWISVRIVRDDPDVLGGMYRTDTNTVFIDMGDLDGERYVAPDASAPDANLANRLAKSQNIRTTLAHEFHHIFLPFDGDPIPAEQHLFVGGPGLDENQVMSDLGFPLRRVAYGSSDGVPYEAFGKSIFLRSAPTIVAASGDRETHRLEAETASGFADLAKRMVEAQRLTVILDADLDGLPDTLDSCPKVFGPANRLGCVVPDGSRIPLPLTGVAAAVSTDRQALPFTWMQIEGQRPNTDDLKVIPTRLEYVIQRPRRRGFDVEEWFPAPDVAFPLAALVSANTLTLPSVQTATLVSTDQTQAAVVEPTRIGAPEKLEAVSRATPFVFARGVNRVFTVRQDRTGPSGTRALVRPSLKLFFISLGQSSGDAVRMIAVNDGNVPVEVALDAVVLEPVSGVTATDVDRSLASLAGLPRVERTLKAYCRDMRRGVPPAGTVMRIAADAAQSSLGPAQRAFAAARQLVERGVLVPDVDRELYLDSIRQWALWTLQERFTESAFVAAFIEHTRKNVIAAGERWQNRYQQEARALAAERWRAVQRVLSESQVK